MTREEAKELLPIIKAYAEGKKIQVKCKTSSDALTEHWVDVTNPDLDNPNNYRIKPEPTYRPFANAEECWQEMQKHQPFGWIRCKEIDSLLCIGYICKDTVSAEGGCLTTFKILFEQGDTFADGEPFGVKEDAQ